MLIYATYAAAPPFTVGVCTHFQQGKGILESNLALIRQAEGDTSGADSSQYQSLKSITLAGAGGSLFGALLNYALALRIGRPFFARVEHWLRRAPLQWFNFYPFWAWPVGRRPAGA